MHLNASQGKILTKLARQSLENKLLGAGHDLGQLAQLAKMDADVFQVEMGVFVTLTQSGDLRGCIGNIEPVGTVFDSVARLSLEAALNDYRFSPVTAAELTHIKIEVSLLTPKKEVKGQDLPDAKSRAFSIRPYVDGVVLEKDGYQATFLPQVWESLPDLEDFLSHLAMKAGLPQTAWQEEGVRLYTYQVQHFNED